MAYLDESLLDSPDAIETIDQQGSIRALATAGAQVRRAVLAAQEADIDTLAGGQRPRSVLIASLGGARAVGDILDVLAEPASPVPLTTRAEPPLPGWIGPLDLVIAVSHSGRAAGPVALAAEAARRGAALLTVGAAGSALADVSAQARGVHVDIAIDAPTSRTALWSMLTPVLMAADSLGVIRCPSEVLDAVADELDLQATQCRPSSESFVNPAKTLALDLAQTVPVILAENALMGVAAARAAAMLSRTSRIPATHGSLPDAAAQIVACFDGPFAAGGVGSSVGSSTSTSPSGERDIFADPYLDGPATMPLGLLQVRDADDDAASTELADAVATAASGAGVRVMQALASSGHPLQRLASVIALIDFATSYVAVGLGLDPSRSAHVDDLHQRTRPQ